MNQSRVPPNLIPDWFLQTVRVMQDIDRGLQGIETEMRHAMRLEGLDPRVRTEMQYVRDALGAVKISLSLMDVSAKQVLSELAAPEKADDQLAAAG
jgi:hypothetical protein